MIKLLTTLVLFASLLQAMSIKTQQRVYPVGQYIRVDVMGMAGGAQDWIGIYPAGSSNDWENVVAWKWSDGIVDGKIFFSGLQHAGRYDVRAFYNNSFHTEASYTFQVEELQTTISTSKTTYDTGETISVSVENMSGDSQDWVGIYPAGSSNDWGNVVTWAWTNGIHHGDISLEGVSAGNYEVRAFFNNSFHTEASASFHVQAVNLAPTVYEDAEGGISGDWWTSGGPHHPIHVPNGFHSSGAVQLKVHWIDNYTNISEYKLDLHHNTSQFVLDLDVGGVGHVGQRPGGIHSNWSVGTMPHYILGVIVSTTQGERLLNWSSWYTHEGFKANRKVLGNGLVQITYPSPWEQLRGNDTINLWEHHHFDLQAWLQTIEPHNKILSVNTFIATGGNLDNITLSSH